MSASEYDQPGRPRALQCSAGVFFSGDAPQLEERHCQHSQHLPGVVTSDVARTQGHTHTHIDVDCVQVGDLAVMTNGDVLVIDGGRLRYINASDIPAPNYNFATSKCQTYEIYTLNTSYSYNGLSSGFMSDVSNQSCSRCHPW